MTVLLFRDDAYRRATPATVVAVEPEGVVLDQTVFYARGGGQPGDIGTLTGPDSRRIGVTDTTYAADRVTVLHKVAPDALATLAVGDTVTAELAWVTRYARMRIHTALHLLTTVLAFPVTGGAIGDGDGRLDFDMPSSGDDRATIEAKLNASSRAICPCRQAGSPTTNSWPIRD